MSDRLGLIPLERLKSVPKRYWKEHEFCFHIHDMMVQSLIEVEQAKLTHVKIDLKTEQQLKVFESLHGDGLVNFLESEGFTDEVQKMLTGQVSISLFSDMLHFVYESLIAFEKRKFSVGFSLLRKPLKENLMFLAWLCADEGDFYKSFSDPVKTMNSRVLKRERRVDIFNSAVSQISSSDIFNGEIIQDTIWDKSENGNLAILFDKATHLVTTMGDEMKTETQNFNFIFKDPLQDDMYDALYHRLAYLLIFALFVQFVLYERMGHEVAKLKKWSRISLLGAYEALFVKGRPKMLSSIKSAFQSSEFFACPHCKAQNKILKKQAADFFITQNIECHNCKRTHQFPLFWMMSVTGLEIS